MLQAGTHGIVYGFSVLNGKANRAHPPCCNPSCNSCYMIFFTHGSAAAVEKAESKKGRLDKIDWKKEEIVKTLAID